MVNAPASRSEVTLPADGPGGSGGSPRPSGLREARLTVLRLRLGFCRARLADISRGPEPWARGAEQAAAAGERRGFQDAAAWFCQTASCSPSPVPSSPGPWLGRGVGLSPRPAVHGSARGGRRPDIFCCELAAELPSPPPENPKGVVREVLGSWASAPFLGLRPLQTRVGSGFLVERRVRFWGTIPCASFCLPGVGGRKSLLGNVQEIGRSEQETGSSGLD